MFDNNDLIFVPAGEPLIFDDVYRWRRFQFDVSHFGLRIRTAAFDVIAGRMRAALEIARHSPRFAEEFPDAESQMKAMIHDLSLISGSLHGEIPESLKQFLHSEDGSWWIHLSDAAAESFHEDDYESVVMPVAGERTPYLTFGTVSIKALDNLEIALAEDDENNLPFSVDVAAEGGLTRGPMPLLEPLPLIREFCGVHGASAFGRTTNVSTVGDVSSVHQFCTPVGRIGKHLFLTLYVHYAVQVEAPVMTRVPDSQLQHLIDELQRSKFEIVSSEKTHCILERNGDVVHIYSGLDGKEAEGFEFMPSCVLVASAGGEFDPMMRAELLEAILERGK